MTYYMAAASAHYGEGRVIAVARGETMHEAIGGLTEWCERLGVEFWSTRMVSSGDYALLKAALGVVNQEGE